MVTPALVCRAISAFAELCVVIFHRRRKMQTEWPYSIFYVSLPADKKWTEYKVTRKCACIAEQTVPGRSHLNEVRASPT